MDKRTPVSVEMVGRFKVTIYDQALYDAHLQRVENFPQGKNPDTRKYVERDNNKPSFANKKPAARWNWTHKLEAPLGGKA